MAIDPAQALFARDFLFEVMKDSQRLRAGYLAERERWLRTLAIDGREEVLFEFEMLLRGLERYFNVHNLPIESQQDVMSRDYREEMRTARDAIHRAVQLTQLCSTLRATGTWSSANTWSCSSPTTARAASCSSNR